MTVIQGFEFQRKTLVVLGVSTAVGLIPAVILSVTISPFFMLLVPAIITVGSYWFFVTKSREGMKLSRYQTITDKKKANLGEFHICFEPISEMPGRGTIIRQTIDVMSEDQETAEERPVISAGTSTKRGKKGKPSPETVIVG